MSASFGGPLNQAGRADETTALELLTAELAAAG
jgi:hypothetical protein